MKIDINLKEELFRWGPVDARIIYVCAWSKGLNWYNRNYEPGSPTWLTYYQNNSIIFITDVRKLCDNGEKVFKKHILEDKRFNNNRQKWEKMLLGFKRTLEKLDDAYIGQLSKEDLYKEFKAWNELYTLCFWGIGSLPEMSNWGGEQLLVKELTKKIKDPVDFNYALERLTAPEEDSFYQKEELDLLSLKFIKNKKEFSRRLREHQKKYFWLLNSYYDVKILDEKYFLKNLKAVDEKEAKKKIQAIKELGRYSCRDKKATVKKYKLSLAVLKISQRLAFTIWWQDLRKSYIFQANHVTKLFLEKIAAECVIPIDDLYCYMMDEVEQLLKENVRLGKIEIKKRKNDFVQILWAGKNTSYLSGSEARKTYKPYEKKEVVMESDNLRGVSVNRGMIKGKVKIILSPKNLDEMKRGDILVAAMTTPDYILALRKAAAIVTDEGGMTCHAAIVARGLKIPAIVATKIATKVLHDGDWVEVDANKGVVKILKKK